jgi:hypothetical protein
MVLTQGHFQAYDFSRMVVMFTMMNDKVETSKQRTRVRRLRRSVRALWLGRCRRAFRARLPHYYLSP